MSGRLTTIEDKVAMWNRVFEALRIELTPAPLRALLATMTEVEGVPQLQSYLGLATAVMANDRQAATVAAMLVNGGVRPPESVDSE